MQDDLVVDSECRYLHTFNCSVASLTRHQCLVKKDSARHEAARETVRKLLCWLFFLLDLDFFLNPLHDQFCEITQTNFTTFSARFWWLFWYFEDWHHNLPPSYVCTNLSIYPSLKYLFICLFVWPQCGFIIIQWHCRQWPDPLPWEQTEEWMNKNKRKVDIWLLWLQKLNI